MYRRSSYLYALCPLLMTALVSGCGGGGSSTPSRTAAKEPSNVSSANAESAAAQSINTIATLDGAVSGDPVSNDVATDLALVVSATSITALATTETVRYCGPDPATDTGNGSVTIVKNDVDPAGRSTGDSVTMTYNACVKGPATVNGTRKFEIVTLTGDPSVPTQPWTLKLTRNSDLTIATATGTGTHTDSDNVEAGTTDGIVTNRSVTGKSAHTSTGTSGDRTRDFTIKTQSDSNLNTFKKEASITSTSSVKGKTTIATPTPLTGTIGSPPTAGVIKLEQFDTAGALTRAVTLTAQADGQVRVEIDSNGDGVVDTTVTVPWSQLVTLGLSLRTL